MEVAWSKVGVIWRMVKDFPLEISQRLICLVGSIILPLHPQWSFTYLIMTSAFLGMFTLLQSAY
jgi:lauroyl/myristoyl acyltransferase